jgi:hypothetical protein
MTAIAAYLSLPARLGLEAPSFESQQRPPPQPISCHPQASQTNSHRQRSPHQPGQVINICKAFTPAAQVNHAQAALKPIAV